MSAELAPGTRVGRYQLLFRLGKGGMGEVWAAATSQAELGFQKLIALKVLRSKELTSTAAVMFFDEAKAASSLQHQAIVSTVDLGRDGEILYIAMDMVRGPSLTALLQRLVITKRQASPAMVAHIGIQIASALDYAHDRAMVQGQRLKLVHRDVSPHNVLLDLNGSVKLTDFGVARTTVQAHESQVGTVRGKPSYMAPEQVRGEHIDARTDLFALGIVLYETSCLKRLFGRSNPIKSMDAVLKHPPKSLLQAVPGYPAPLWRVIQRALEKDPAHRFQSPAELRDALEEAAKPLPGFPSAARDLVTLVTESFESDAFDIDGRVREVMDEIEAANATNPTRAVRRADLSPQVEGFDPRLAGTKMAWPSAHSPDPLAPEAIEQARTHFGAPTPSASAGIRVMPSATADQISIGGYTPMGTRSGTWAGDPSHRWLVPGIAILTAAIVLAATVTYVVTARPSAGPIPVSVVQPIEPPSNPQARAKPVLVPVAPSPATPAPPPRTRKPPTKKSNKVPTRVRPPRSRPKPTKKAAARPDATYDEVRDLVLRVRAVDEERGRAMLPTLIEAGRDNTAKLNQLRKEALRLLREPRSR